MHQLIICHMWMTISTLYSREGVLKCLYIANTEMLVNIRASGHLIESFCLVMKPKQWLLEVEGWKALERMPFNFLLSLAHTVSWRPACITWDPLLNIGRGKIGSWLCNIDFLFCLYRLLWWQTMEPLSKSQAVGSKVGAHNGESSSSIALILLWALPRSHYET